MPRCRAFDADEALEKAMQVFWAKGYEATSLNDLTAAMGLSKSSFYETFGCKHELFLAALDRYNETVAGCGAAEIIDRAGGARAGITAVFRHYVDVMSGGGDRRGCFVGNSAVEMAPHDAAAAAKVSAGLSRLEETFLRAVERGQAAGEIPLRHGATALARYLTGSLNGLILLAKAGRDRLALQEVARITLSALG